MVTPLNFRVVVVFNPGSYSSHFFFVKTQMSGVSKAEGALFFPLCRVFMYSDTYVVR